MSAWKMVSLSPVNHEKTFMTMPCSILAAALSVTTPSGETVCRVTPPDLPADAVIETTNLTGGVA